MDTAQQPDKLKKEAGDLLTQIGTNHWDSFKEERVKHVENPEKFRTDVIHTRQPVDSLGYQVKKLEPDVQKDVLEKRKDPKIAPPEQLHVRQVIGDLAYVVPKPDDNPDPYMSMDDADPINKQRRERNNENSNLPGMAGDGTTQQQLKPKRRLKATYDLGAQFAIAGASTGEGMGDAMGGEGGMPGSGAGGGRGGGGPGGMGGMGGGMPGGMGGGMPGGMGGIGGGAGGPGGAGLGAGPKGPTHRIGSTPVVFNAITALIPHRKNFEEYQNTFLHTGTFNSARDLPQYLGIEVQRVEVTDSEDPNREIKESEWKTILTNREIADMPVDMYKEKNFKNPKFAWATHFPTERGMTRLGRPLPEVIDPRAVMKGLTAPIPPLLIRDYREFAKHPAISWAWNSRAKRARQSSKGDGANKRSDEDDVVFDGSSAGQGASGFGGEGMGGGPGGPGGSGDESGYGYGSEAGGESFGGEDYSSGFGGDGGEMGGGPGGMGGRGMGGMGGMGGGGFGTSLANLKPENQPEFKMIRVYDFLKATDIHKSYRYRIRVKMRDPNYPENQDYNPTFYKSAPQPLPPPENRELDHDVFVRVSKLRETDDKVLEENKKKTVYKARTMRLTDWSEPSSPVFVHERSDAFVGEVVTTAEKVQIRNIVITQPSTDPKLPGAVFAADLAADRGAVLGSEASKTPLEFIAPTNKLIKKVEGKSILPGLVVVDIRGGQALQGHKPKDDELLSTGEVMIMRPDGSMIISNTRDDHFLWRMYSFKDDKEAAEREKKNEGNAGSMGGGMGGSMGGTEGGGFPGGPGGGGRGS